MSPEKYSYVTGIFINREMKLNKLVLYIFLSHAETNEGKSEKQKLSRIFYSLRKAKIYR